MNHIHRVVWSHIKGVFVAVAEIAHSQGKTRASVTRVSVQADSNFHKNFAQSILTLAVVALCGAPTFSAHAQTVIDGNQTVVVFDWVTQAGDAGAGGGGSGIGGGGGGGGDVTFGGGGGYGGGGGGIAINAGGGGGLNLGLAPGTGSGGSNGYAGIGGGAGALGLGSGGDGTGSAGGGNYHGDNGVGGGLANDGKGGNGFGGGGGGTGPALVGGGAGGVTEGGHGKVNGALNGNYGHGGGLGVTAGELGVGVSNTQTHGSSGTEYVVNGGFLTIFGGSGGGGGATLINTGDDGLGTTLSNVVVNTNGVVNLIGGVGGGGGFTTGAVAGDGFGSTVNNAQINGGVFNVFGGAGGGANSSVIAVLPNGNNGGDGTGAQLNNSTINGGILNVYGGANGQNAQYDGVLVDGIFANGGSGSGGSVSNLSMTGGTLNLYAGTNESTPNSASAYGGEGAKASNITNSGGTINLGAGVGTQTAPTLSGTYAQSAGALNLNGGAFTATNGGSFSGGAINVAAGKNYILTGTTFDGSGGQVATDATGGALSFTNATVSGAHLNLGTSVTLNGSTTVSDGSVNLNTGGTISGVYTQTGGALNLSGGTYSATASTSSFSGGSINNTGTADTTLNGVRFTGGNVSTSASSGSELYLSNAAINNSNVTIGQYVHLGTSTADAATISGNGGLINQGAAYLGAVNTTGSIQSSGDLTLTSSVYTASSSSFTGGSLIAASGGSIVVNNASFNGNVSTSASSGSLQLSNANVNAGANLGIAAHVTLEGVNAGTLNVAGQGVIQNLTNAGVINLAANSELGSGYTQSAGILNFNGTGIATASGAVFNGGAINSNVATTLSDAVFNGAVNTDATGGSLLFSNASVNATANLTVGTQVTLEGSNAGIVNALEGTIQNLNSSGIVNLGNNSTLGVGYVQNAGALNFDGTGITANSGSTFNAGDINAINGTAAILQNATLNGMVNTNGGIGSLTLEASSITTGNAVNAGQNVSFVNTSDNAGTLNINTGASISGTYQQTNGILNINDASTHTIGSSILNGGQINANAGTTTITSAMINADLVTEVASGANLNINNAQLNNGVYTNYGASVTLSGFSSANADYVQDGGTLQINTDLSGAVAGDITIKGGTITNNITPGVDSPRTVSNVSFGESLKGLPIIVAVGDTSSSKLTLNAFTVDNTTLEARKNTVLITATVTNNGVLVLEDNATISGTTTLLNGGALKVSGIPGSITTTLENLTGQDGKIHIRTNFITGTSDRYIINGTSDGNFMMLINSKGFGKGMELLRDRLGIHAEARFTLESGSNVFYEDDGGFLAANTLYSYDEAGYRLWVLDRAANGYSATASSAATAATVTLEQVHTGMNELSRRLGDLRTNSNGYENGSWIRTYGRHSTVDTQSKISMSLGGVELGYDHLVSANDSGRIYLGAVGGMQWLGSGKMTQRYGPNGTGHGQAPSAGIYGTWLAEDGWFIDATMRHFWTDSTLTSYQFNGMPVNYGSKVKAIAGSFEVGKRIHLNNQSWIFEPRAEIQFARIGSHNTMTSTGSYIKYGSTNSVLANVGANINYQHNNQLYYVKSALVYEFDGKTDMRMTGMNTPVTAHLQSDPSGARGLIGTGLNWGLSRNLYLYADVDWEHGSSVRSFGGNIGVRGSW